MHRQFAQYNKCSIEVLPTVILLLFQYEKNEEIAKYFHEKLEGLKPQHDSLESFLTMPTGRLKKYLETIDKLIQVSVSNEYKVDY